MSKVLINLKLSVRQSILIRFKLLRKFRELCNQRLININFFELSLATRPLSNLDGPCDLRVFTDLSECPLNDSFLNHFASEVEIVPACLRSEILDQIFIYACQINHRLMEILQSLRQLALYGLFQVSSQLHL